MAQEHGRDWVWTAKPKLRPHIRTEMGLPTNAAGRGRVEWCPGEAVVQAAGSVPRRDGQHAGVRAARWPAEERREAGRREEGQVRRGGATGEVAPGGGR